MLRTALGAVLVLTGLVVRKPEQIVLTAETGLKEAIVS